MKNEKKNTDRILISLVLLILIVSAAIYGPSLYSVITAVGCSAVLLSRSARNKRFKLLSFLPLVVIFFTIQTQISVISDMAQQKGLRNDIKGNETIIVPGAGINGDQPSVYLRARLDGALTLLKKYPDTNIIVTGGKAPREEYSESFVMKKYLTDNGISDNRIFMEDRSVNTMENYRFAKEIIDSKSLNSDIITVTNSFHNLRCSMITRYLNMNSIGAPAITPILPLRIFYTLKETASFIKLLIITRFGLV